MSEIQSIEIPFPLWRAEYQPCPVILIGSDDLGDVDPDDQGEVVIDAGLKGSWVGQIESSNFKIVSYQTEDTINFLYLYLVKVYWQGVLGPNGSFAFPADRTITPSTGGTDDVMVTITDSGGTVVGTQPVKVVID